MINCENPYAHIDVLIEEHDQTMLDSLARSEEVSGLMKEEMEELKKTLLKKPVKNNRAFSWLNRCKNLFNSVKTSFQKHKAILLEVTSMAMMIFIVTVVALTALNMIFF